MEGVVCFGTLGPQVGTQERKCSRECNLLKWNDRHARVPCVSSRGEMIDWERLEEGGMKWHRGVLQWVFKKYTHFVFVYAGNRSQFLSTETLHEQKCAHSNHICTHMESTFTKYTPYQIKWQAESWESCFYEFGDLKKNRMNSFYEEAARLSASI